MKTSTQISWAGVAWFLWVIAILAACGYMDRDTPYMEQARYCRMVATKQWPDYAHSFKQECTPAGKVKDHAASDIYAD